MSGQRRHAATSADPRCSLYESAGQGLHIYSLRFARKLLGSHAAHRAPGAPMNPALQRHCAGPGRAECAWASQARHCAAALAPGAGRKVCSGQSRHAVWLRCGWNVPGAHSRHACEASRWNPGAHWQSPSRALPAAELAMAEHRVGCSAPGPQKLSAGHSAHAALPDAFFQDPAAHATHSSAACAWCPASHTQVAAAKDPCSCVLACAWHGAHGTSQACVLNSPRTHSWQLCKRLKRPRSH